MYHCRLFVLILSFVTFINVVKFNINHVHMISVTEHYSAPYWYTNNIVYKTLLMGHNTPSFMTCHPLESLSNKKKKE